MWVGGVLSGNPFWMGSIQIAVALGPGLHEEVESSDQIVGWAIPFEDCRRTAFCSNAVKKKTSTVSSFLPAGLAFCLSGVM